MLVCDNSLSPNLLICIRCLKWGHYKMLGWIPLTVFKYSDGAQWKFMGFLSHYLILCVLPVLVSVVHVAIPYWRIFSAYVALG